MASNSDKTADSTSGEVNTPNTDALLAPPPEGSHPTHLSEELGSQTIDAPFDAIPGDSDREMSLVPTTTNDCRECLQVPTGTCRFVWMYSPLLGMWREGPLPPFVWD